MCREIVTPLGIAGQQQGVGNRIQKQRREEGDAFGSRESMSLKHPERRVPCHPPAHMWSAHVVVEDPARRHLEQGLRTRNLLQLRPIEFLPIVALRTAMGRSRAEGVESAGPYWHFVDLVWVSISTFSYLI
jgi:hypothetical protein